MPRRKKTEWEKLAEDILADLKERGVYKPGVDDHLITAYVSQAKIVKQLQDEIDGAIITDGERNDEPVANPALVRLPSAMSNLVQLGKHLGIGPGGRKATSGAAGQPKAKKQTGAAALRPLKRTKTG